MDGPGTLLSGLRPQDTDMLFPQPSKHMPSLNAANLIIAFTSLFFLLASYAVLFSAFLPLTSIPVRPRITTRAAWLSPDVSTPSAP